MSFIGTQINKLNGGLGGGETSDRVAVLVLGTEATEKLEHNKAYELMHIDDAISLGITEESDLENKKLNYYHLSEVFRLSPETRVHLITVPSATKPSELKGLEVFVSAVRSISGINTISVAGLTPDADVTIAAQGLQLLVDAFGKDYIYIDAVLLEGVGSYLGEEITDFPNLRKLDSENVSVIIGQDPAVALIDEAYKTHASVGSALGMLLVRSIHENLGSVDVENKPRRRKAEQDYTLTDIKLDRWLSSQLSNGIPFDAISVPNQKKLDELGYIYVGGFNGYGGFFFSDSHSCTEAEDDYCYIERNAIWNKAARIIRQTLIPRIRSKVEADPTTGFIKHTTITDWDGRVRKSLEEMVRLKNIADFDIYINPNQAAVSTKPFNIKVQLVADGIVHEFEVDLGFTKSI